MVVTTLRERTLRVFLVIFVCVLLGYSMSQFGNMIKNHEKVVEHKKIDVPQVIEEPYDYYFYDLDDPSKVYTRDQDGNFIEVSDATRSNLFESG